jgi:hypothetical protein
MLSTARWRTSSHSYSEANCVEAAGAWHRSGHCNGGTCVEVAPADGVLVRDSKDPDGPILAFTRSEWADFASALKFS